jgi:hypothetical protein
MKRWIVSVTPALAALLIGGAANAAEVFGYTGAIQTWVVPATGEYDILGAGAQGGSSEFPEILGTGGGLGAEVGGEIDLTAGEIIQIVVGQVGSGPPAWGSGGGGATWVFINGAANPLLVAGGGGGQGYIGLNGSGGAGQATLGGSGQGGAAGDGGGGAGWLGNGADGTSTVTRIAGSGGLGPSSFQGGYSVGGPFGIFDGVDLQTGGYGGGGAGGYNDGGGGGGYTGGAAGQGGGSYLGAGFTQTVGASGANTGNGFLTINPVPEPAEWVLLMAGLAAFAATRYFRWSRWNQG